MDTLEEKLFKRLDDMAEEMKSNFCRMEENIMNKIQSYMTSHSVMSSTPGAMSLPGISTAPPPCSVVPPLPLSCISALSPPPPPSCIVSQSPPPPSGITAPPLPSGINAPLPPSGITAPPSSDTLTPPLTSPHPLSTHLPNQENYFTSLLLDNESHPSVLPHANSTSLPGNSNVFHPEITKMVDYTFGIVLNTFQPETLKTHTISGKRGHKKKIYQIQLIKQQVMSTFPAVTEYDWAGIMERLTLKLKNHRNKLAKCKEKVIN